MRATIFLVLFVTTCALALWRGRTLHRAIAIIFLAGAIATVVTWTSSDRRYASFEWGLATIDGLMTIGLVWIAAKSRDPRFTMIAALQLVTLMFHPSKAIMPGSYRTTYKIVLSFGSYLQLLLLMWATLRQAPQQGLWKFARLPESLLEPLNLWKRPPG